MDKYHSVEIQYLGRISSNDIALMYETFSSFLNVLYLYHGVKSANAQMQWKLSLYRYITYGENVRSMVENNLTF